MINKLAKYITQVQSQALPEAVHEKARQHILDTFAAMLSGTTLLSGKRAREYSNRVASREDAMIVGWGNETDVVSAALLNGMLAHANETDDSHAPSLTHPGCAIVPAAYAMADYLSSSGEEFIRAVVLGYDICTRINLTMGVEVLEETQRSTYSISGAFGAMAAAASLARLNEEEIRYALSLTAQQASGVASWRRDLEHIEKSLVFAGFPARNGVTAVDMVREGFTAVPDVFSGPTTFFGAFSPDADPNRLIEGLGVDYEILRTNIKRWSVGSPIQAGVDSLVHLMKEHDLDAFNVAEVVCRLPTGGAETVDDRHMPDINLQHILAITLLDSDLKFVASQDYERMTDPAVLQMKKKISLIGDPQLDFTDPPRQGIIELRTTDGRNLTHRTYAVRGTYDNPMTTEEVQKKAQDLIEPLIGSRVNEVIQAFDELHTLKNIRDLRPVVTI